MKIGLGGVNLISRFILPVIYSEGQDAVPDYLSISFSGVDAVNRFFGPSSLENEDVVIHLDRSWRSHAKEAVLLPADRDFEKLIFRHKNC